MPMVHVEVHDLSCDWRTYWCLWSMLPIEAMLMSVVVVMVLVSGDVCGPCMLCLKTMLMPVIPIASRGHVLFVLPHETRLMFLVYFTAEPCLFLQAANPMSCLWPMLLPETMLTSVNCIAS